MKFLVVIIFFSISFNAFAKQYVGSIVMKMKQSNSTSTFYLANSDAKNDRYDYVQQSSSGQVFLDMYGTGAFADMKDKKSDYLTDVPGVTSKGHSKLSVSKVGKKYFLGTDIQTYTTVDNEEVAVPLQIASETTIYDGSWKKYEGGDVMFMEYTDDAAKRLLDSMVSKIELIFEPIKKQLKSNGLTMEPMRVVKAEFTGRSNITASLNELNIYLAPYDTHVEYDIYLD